MMYNKKLLHMNNIKSRKNISLIILQEILTSFSLSNSFIYYNSNSVKNRGGGGEILEKAIRRAFTKVNFRLTRIFFNFFYSLKYSHPRYSAFEWAFYHFHNQST